MLLALVAFGLAVDRFYAFFELETCAGVALLKGYDFWLRWLNFDKERCLGNGWPLFICFFLIWGENLGDSKLHVFRHHFHRSSLGSSRVRASSMTPF